MKTILLFAVELQEFCIEQGWRFCYIGGIALLRWGEFRLTRDVDIALLTGYGGEKSFVDALCERFKPRIPDAAAFALTNRTLLVESDKGIPADIALAALPFEETMIDRATDFAFLPEIRLKTCSAEDLIVLKSFADRDRDWSDVRSIAIKQKSLDWEYIFRNLEPLVEVKGNKDALVRLEALRHPRLI